MSHIGQTFMLMCFLQHGSCTIQPTQLPFSSDEPLDMVHRCGLNRLNQFASFLGTHLRNARSNPVLLAALKSLHELLYTGLPLAVEEEALHGEIALEDLLEVLRQVHQCERYISVGRRGKTYLHTETAATAAC